MDKREWFKLRVWQLHRAVYGREEDMVVEKSAVESRPLPVFDSIPKSYVTTSTAIAPVLLVPVVEVIVEVVLPMVDPKEQKRRDKRAYYRRVRELTELQPLHTLKHIELRAWQGYHLDHIVSVSDGFRNSILPELVADISNLQMLTKEANELKGSISNKDDLMSLLSKCLA